MLYVEFQIKGVATLRDLILIGFIFGGLLLTLRYPFVGLLLWAWFTLATPHQAAYSAGALPLNMLIAGVTIVSYFFHREFLNIRITPIFALLGLFGFWLWLSQNQSLDPGNSALYYDRFSKILIFVFLCLVMVTDKLRFHALLWVFAIVMGFYGAKGGMFTILTFGQNIYFGLPDNILYDNNHMGIALAASLPVFLYLHGQSAQPYVRLGLKVVFVLTVIAIIGTHSRGAFIALVIFGLGWLLHLRQRAVILVCAMLLAIPTLALLPGKWFERMSTISSATQDDSFMGRVEAWEINYKLAVKHPLTGAGLRNPYEEDIAQTVDLFLTPRAAHSIYFEILGGMGFAGLFIYLALLGTAFLSAFAAYRRYRHDAAQRWRSEFGKYAQIALVTFGIGGASVSMEMWEGYLLIVALIGALGLISSDITGERKNGKNLPWKNATG